MLNFKTLSFYAHTQTLNFYLNFNSINYLKKQQQQRVKSSTESVVNKNNRTIKVQNLKFNNDKTVSEIIYYNYYE